MKKVLYALAIALFVVGCSGETTTTKDGKEVKEGIAKGTQVVIQPEGSKIKEVVEGVANKPITIETAPGKMHGKIEFPGAITLSNPKAVEAVISKLTPAQGKNTYNCAVLFSGVKHKGKIWNFTRKPVMVNVEWKYEGGAISTDQVAVESEGFGFTHADKEKGEPVTITYSVVDLE